MAIVDIIMGVYNEEDVIGRAIESILNQQDENWRLLVCDDGSTDNTFNIIEGYGKKFPDKIIVLKNEINRGLSYSLNKMIKKTNAKYIARMDADDVSNSVRIKEEREFLDNHLEYAMVGSAVNKFDDDGIFASKIYPENPSKKDFFWNNPFAHSTIMIRSEVLKELGGYRDIPRTLRCEDYDLWMRLYEKGYRGYNLRNVLLNYYESRRSYGKRRFRYRLNEAATRFDGYRRNGWLLSGFIYTLKPIFVGIIPANILMRWRKG